MKILTKNGVRLMPSRRAPEPPRVEPVFRGHAGSPILLVATAAGITLDSWKVSYTDIRVSFEASFTQPVRGFFL